MGNTNIKWVKEADEPFYVSACGRFEINPLFNGRTRPQGWQVVDTSTKESVRTWHGISAAKKIAAKMLNPEPKPQPVVPTEKAMREAFEKCSAQGNTTFAAEIKRVALEKYGYTI